VHNPLQVFVKVTEQDTALTLGKIARYNFITTFKLFNESKKDCGNEQFSVCERQPIES